MPLVATDRKFEVIGDSIGVGCTELQPQLLGRGCSVACPAATVVQVGYGNLGNLDDRAMSDICFPRGCGGKPDQLTV